MQLSVQIHSQHPIVQKGWATSWEFKAEEDILNKESEHLRRNKFSKIGILASYFSKLGLKS